MQDRGSRRETYGLFARCLSNVVLRTAYLSFFSPFFFLSQPILPCMGRERGVSVLMRGKYCKDMRLDPRGTIGKSSIGYCSDLSIGFYCII